MKIEFNKLRKVWEIRSDVFNRKHAEFHSKKEAEYYLSSNFRYKIMYKIPNLPMSMDV